jgi:2-polyprenyl-3-methyl-5-hydroxy-6-metoxy-1,4-benzoquinol methylase
MLNNSFSQDDIRKMVERYSCRYGKFGYDPKSLGWERGNQEIRFEVLTSQYDFRNKKILDIGCGFGDLNKYLIRKGITYDYLGIDLVDAFIIEAEKHYSADRIQFRVINILDLESDLIFDYAIASGIFNHQLSDADNYTYVESVIRKTLQHTKDGLAFDFLSDKVDYRKPGLFYNNTERILSIAYKFSKKITLRHDYMPFEFSIFIQKDQSYNAQNLIYNSYNSSL